MQYREAVTNKNQAFCHLLLFFSLFEDETFKGEETYQIYSILQAYSFTAGVDFPEEVNLFFDYKESIGDERTYFEYLAGLMDSDAPDVILFHAAQVALSDAVFSVYDKHCLELLRNILLISDTESKAILQLVSSQRKLKLKGEF